MSKRHSASAISCAPAAGPSTGVTATPPARQDAPQGLGEVGAARRDRRWTWFVLGASVLLALGIVAGVWTLWNRGAFAATGYPAPPADPDWSKAPVTEDERLCADFVKKKNAGDPAAAELLGRTPAVPSEPVSRVEADRLQTDYFLRQDVHIVGTRRGPTPGTLILSTKGVVRAPRLEVHEGDSASTEARAMYSPDLTVEVHDGKIFGVRPALGQ